MLPCAGPQGAAEHFGHAVGLLEDFLEHVVRILAALGFLGRPIHGTDGALDGLALGLQGEVLVGQRDDVAVVQVDDLAGVGDDGGNVAGEEVLAVADADHERRAAAGAEEVAGQVSVQEGDAVGAVDLARGGEDGLDEPFGRGAAVSGERLVEVIADEVGEDFGVRLRKELVPVAAGGGGGGRRSSR